VPNNGGRVTGGIYIHGRARLAELSVNEDGHQVYRLRDGYDQTTTITVDYENENTLWESSTGTHELLDGTPNGVLFVRGQVNDLRGPGRTGGSVLPALADRSQLNIVATGDIIIQDDVTVHDFENGESVLGLFTSGGDVRIATNAPDDLRVDAFVMAAAENKVFTVDDYAYGGYRGEVHLRGGMITNYYGAFGTFSGTDMTGYGRDFHYDRRGYVPPYFPLTQRFVTDKPSPQVLSWHEAS